MSASASRKKERPSRISIERVKGSNEHGRSGGHIVEHQFDNTGAGESYRPSEKHVFTNHKDMMAHLLEATGGEQGETAADEVKEPVKDKEPKTAKAPGPRTFGAGAD